MVLELIIIGGAVWYYANKRKQQKRKLAAFNAGQPILNKDGSITYPPNYGGCPVHAEQRHIVSHNTATTAPAMANNDMNMNVNEKTQAYAQHNEHAPPTYRDEPEYEIVGNEKGGVRVGEKEIKP